MNSTASGDFSAKEITGYRLLLNLLNNHEKRQLVFVFVLMFIGSIFEALSLGMVVPVISLLSTPRSKIDNTFVQNVFDGVSDNGFVFIVMAIMVIVFLLKTLFLVWKVWIQKGFSNKLAARISSDLYKGYLRQPYEYFLAKNSSTLIRNSTSGTTLTDGVIDPLLFLVSEGLVTISLFFFLMYLEPVGTLFTLIVFVLGAWSYRKPTARRIEKWGESDNDYKAKLIQQVHQGFGGIKDVKMLRREKYFADLFNGYLLKSSSISKQFSFVQSLPRYFLELLTIVCFAALVSSMVAFGSGLGSVIPVLGLFGVASFRILPATYQIINSVQAINKNRSLLSEISIDLAMSGESLHLSEAEVMEFEVLEISNLKFSYVEGQEEALIDVSVLIKRGEAVGLVGQSGSGKSTLVDVLLGFLAPQFGTVSVNGVNIDSSMQWWRSKVGYVPQSIFLTDDTLRKNVAFGLPDEEIDENSVRSALRLAQLEDFVSSLPEGENTMVGERGVRLSGGQRQRIGIARALYNNPEVLVLDEATSSLDTETEHGVMQAVQALQGDKTVIIVAHRLSTVEYCDRLYRLYAGRIVDEGTFDEVMNRSQS
jgi:ABC-type multidrug transport system fused ATPase/permease subunit